MRAYVLLDTPYAHIGWSGGAFYNRVVIVKFPGLKIRLKKKWLAIERALAFTPTPRELRPHRFYYGHQFSGPFLGDYWSAQNSGLRGGSLNEAHISPKASFWQRRTKQSKLHQEYLSPLKKGKDTEVLGTKPFY